MSKERSGRGFGGRGGKDFKISRRGEGPVRIEVKPKSIIYRWFLPPGRGSRKACNFYKAVRTIYEHSMQESCRRFYRCLGSQ